MTMDQVLYITEYSQFGDPAAESPVEPATLVQKIRVGEKSQPLHRDTRLVVLYSTFDCRVSFHADEHEEEHAWPMSLRTRTVQLTRPNTGMTIRVYEDDAWPMPLCNETAQLTWPNTGTEEKVS
jgi:hypothetical protein